MTDQTDNSSGAPPDASGIRLRKPTVDDGVAIWKLIADCPPLDQNSVFCNLLQCAHFAGTCIVAERDGGPVGWISGYLPPAEPETLFIWQVAVHESGRGCGLAGRMLRGLMARPECRDVRLMKTTITPDNKGSFALFRSFASHFDAPFDESEGFDSEAHFKGLHDSERLITIGPIPDSRRERDASRSVA
ncbi:MAG: diaminobutyrate acetyltransferase [Woeseiaceae bacterium]|nr:diaminobutyrate acetyltransferase [Woeseiaceae bacterium]